MSVATDTIELQKEMRNKMEKTFNELQDALIAEIQLEHPNYSSDLVQAVFLGKLLAHTSRETLETLLNRYVQECSRCGVETLASEHPQIGCDL